LWSASTATNLGDGMRLVALPLLASTATTDVRQIASVTVATFAPLLLFGPFAGVLIDRTDRRNAIAVAHLARAVLLLGLAALIAAGHATLGCIVVVAVLYGIGEAVADPASQARSAEHKTSLRDEGQLLLAGQRGAARCDRALMQQGVDMAELVVAVFTPRDHPATTLTRRAPPRLIGSASDRTPKSRTSRSRS
jgi:MFS family permease